jgi:hypothetical protein
MLIIDQIDLEFFFAINYSFISFSYSALITSLIDLYTPLICLSAFLIFLFNIYISNLNIPYITIFQFLNTFYYDPLKLIQQTSILILSSNQYFILF